MVIVVAMVLMVVMPGILIRQYKKAALGYKRKELQQAITQMMLKIDKIEPKLTIVLTREMKKLCGRKTAG